MGRTMKPTVENESCTGCGRDPQINCHVCGHLLYLSEYDDARDERIRELEARIRELEVELDRRSVTAREMYDAAAELRAALRDRAETAEASLAECRGVLWKVAHWLEYHHEPGSCDATDIEGYDVCEVCEACEEARAILDAIEREREVE
jgi:hypothetical protein